MRRVVSAAFLTLAAFFCALEPAAAQLRPPPPVVNVRGGSSVARPVPAITPLGWYAMGSIACAAVAPMIGTVVLGREMTLSEVYHSTFSCVLGPLGWLLADQLFPPGIGTPGRPGQPHGRAPPRGRQAGDRNISVPPLGATGFVVDEVVVEIAARATAQQRERMATALLLTPLEARRFTLTRRTLERWRIGGGRSVPATLLALRRFSFVTLAQPNWFYFSVQNQAAPAAQAPSTQYVVSKLRLNEAHRITDGGDVLVAVIDSAIDTHHPDLAGAVADEYDAIGTPAPPHAHGTAMAGAIAAHGKLIGVAPKVRLLAVRAFSGDGESAQGTTFNVLKGLDWAASKNARIVNMSFAGPADGLLREMLAKAYQRGMVLIAAVGNGGPRSPPLYPAAYRDVIGVTATDADDKLLPLANRGPQVTVAAPGVDILADAPDDKYQLTTGTSVAAALASGVAALVVARDPKLTPAGVRQVMIRSARHIAGKRGDVGAGEIDALGAVEALAKQAR